VEHSVLEKEHMAEFIQQISGVIDGQHPAPAPATEGQSVQLCSVAKSEGTADEVGGNAGMMYGINSSPPSTSDLQKELMPAVGCEVKYSISHIY